MKKYIYPNLKKRQFAEVLPVDASKKGGAWQTELRKAESYGKFDITGVGAGVLYHVEEIYDAPKERVHGNTGKAPINKGAVDENSLKYQLAKLLIKLGSCEFQTKTFYMEMLNLKTKNIEHLEKKFDDAKYHDLNSTDKYVFKQLQNTQLSLHRLMSKAFDLIRKGIFDDVALEEQLYVAFHDESHKEADETLNNPEELHLLYKQAYAEAQKNIEARYGKSMFFVTRMKIIGNEIEEIIASDEKYYPLEANGIAYFYQKFMINGDIEETNLKDDYNFDYEVENYDGEGLSSDTIEEMIGNFLNNFIAHRKQASLSHITKLHEQGFDGDFLSEEIMLGFAEQVFDFMFWDFNVNNFDELYDDLINRAKENYEDTLKEYVENEMSFLPFNM